VSAVVGLGLAVAVAAGAVAVRVAGWHPLVRPAGLLVAGASGLVAVLVAWGVRELSVPATVVGVVGLLVARRVVPVSTRPLLLAAGVVSVAIAGGAVAGLVAGAPLPDRFTVAGVLATILAGLFVAVPVRRLDAAPGARAERLTGAFAAFGVALVGVLVAAGLAGGTGTGRTNGVTDGIGGTESWQPGRFAPSSLALLLTVLLVAALAGAAWPPRETSPAGPVTPILLAVVTAPLAVGAAASAVTALVRAIGTPSPDHARYATLAAAIVLVLAGAGLGTAGVLVPRDGRRLPAEGGAAFAAVVTLLVGTAVAWGTPWLWLVWLALGVAVTLASVPADRRRGGWVGWALLTASSWARLRDADVGLLEAYTVPPAVVLLAVAGVSRWLLHHDGPASLRRTVVVEALAGIAVVGLAAGMVALPPRAAEATQPFAEQLAARGVIAVVSLGPGRVGANEIHVFITPPGGSISPVGSLTTRVSLPAKGIPFAPVTLVQEGPNHYSGNVTFPTSGDWTLELVVQVSASDTVLLSTTVPIP
jgi:hypothetical protein